jgi:filamentous hemagglutinin family protein
MLVLSSKKFRGIALLCEEGARIAAVSSATLALLWGPFVPVFAAPVLPQDGSVEFGSITIREASSSHLVIEQASRNGVINWREFSVSESAHVEFIQPDASSVTLNRVTGSQISEIRGRISAPGRVVLVNPAGVLFTEDAEVNVGSLIASTLDISTQDFLDGNYTFSGGSTNAVINQGRIGVGDGGYVAMVAARIVNQGEIAAPSGSVYFAAGSRVRLDMGGPLQVEVEAGSVNAAIENGGAIRASDGLVYLSARTASDLVASTINHSGIIEATSISRVGGRVVLEGGEIDLVSDSLIDVSGHMGGGDVLIGGDWQGGVNAQRRVFDDPELIREANKVSMEGGASILANATQVGDGGTVVLWSDVFADSSETRAHGSIEAQGGPEGGDGGLIETSGRRVLFSGIGISTEAPSGSVGEWLIDPDTDLAISDIDTDSEASSILTALDTSNVRVVTASGTSIVIDKELKHSGNNVLTFDSGNSLFVRRDLQAGGLVLLAERDLVVDVRAVTLTANSAGGDIIFSADSDGNDTGAPRFDYQVSASTQGGDIVFGGGNRQGTDFPKAFTWEGIEFNGLNLSTNGGDVSIRGTSDSGRGLYFSGTTSIVTLGGNVSIYGESDSENGVYIGGTASIDTGGGNILIDAETEDDRGFEQTGSVTLDSGSGTIYVRGRAGVEGDSTNADHHGVFLNGSGFTLRSSNSTSNAISLIGVGTRGRGIDQNAGAFTVESSSETGGVLIDGTRGSGRNWSVSFAGTSTSILAAGGSITITGRNDNGDVAGTVGYVNFDNTVIGQKASTNVTTSVADVTITSDAFQQSASSGVVPDINTAGEVVIESFSSTFDHAMESDWFNFNSDGGSSISGLTLGKTTSTASVAVNSTLTANGPIAINGNHIFVEQNITSTSSNGAITIRSKGLSSGTTSGYVVVNSGFSLTTNGGDVVLWSNADNRTDGTVNNEIVLRSGSTINTSGGDIVLAGGLDDGGASSGIAGLTAGDGIPDGFAYRGGSGYAGSGVALESGVDLLSSGGDIIIRGQGGVGTTFGVHATSTSIDARVTGSASGDVTIVGISEDKDGSYIRDTDVRGNNVAISGDTDDGDYGISLWASTVGGTTIDADADLEFTAVNQGGVNSNSLRTGANPRIYSDGDITINSTGKLTFNSGQTDFAIASGKTLEINLNGNVQFDTSVGGTGALVIQPLQDDFVGTLSLSDFTFGTSLSGLTIGKAATSADGTSDQDVTLDAVIDINGPVTVYGGDIAISQNIDTAGGAASGDALVKASGNIELASNKSVTSDGGEVRLWANSDGNGGYIVLHDGSTIDTRTAADRASVLTTDATSGGNIWIAGGADDGNGNPGGYALQLNASKVGGVLLGSDNTSDSSISILSGGGDIVIRGKNTYTNAGSIILGVAIFEGTTINSGDAGDISISGSVTGSTSGSTAAVDIQSSRIGAAASQITSNDGVISITGDTNKMWGVLMLANSAAPLTIQSVGSGSVSIDGTSTDADYGIGVAHTRILASSGDINLSSPASALYRLDSGIVLGKLTGSAVTSSASDVTLTFDKYILSSGDVSVDTAGTVQVLSNGASFSSALDSSGLSLASTVTGFTVGKSSNTSNVTLGSVIDIDGPLTIYGGDIAISQNIDTTGGAASGDVLMKSSGDMSLAASKSITTTGGDVILWANTDGQTSLGSVLLRDQSTVSTSGGHIWIGGSASNGGSTNWNGLTVGDGYAVSGLSITPVAGGAFYSGVYLENADLLSGGGDILISAKDSSVGTAGAQRAFVNLGASQINAGTGQIQMDVIGSNEYSFVTGMHNSTTAANFDVISAFDDPSDYAIDISVSTSGDNALIVEGDTTFGSTGRGQIRLATQATVGSSETGLLLGWGGSSVGHLKVLAESGSIELNTGGSSVSVANSSSSGTIGSLAGTVVADSESNIDFIADDISASGPLVFKTSGTLTMRSSGSTFSGTVDLSTLDVGTDLGGLQIGTSTNTANLIFGKDLSVSGPITAYGGDITINSGIELTAGSGSDIVLAGSGDFINNSGSGALVVSGGGRWIVYAGDVIGNTYGSLDSGNQGVFNQSFATLAPASVASGNRYVFNSAGNQSVTFTTTDASKVYGDTIDLTSLHTLASSGVAGETGAYLGISAGGTVSISDVFSVNPTFAASGAAASANVGTSSISASGGTVNSGYSVTFTNTGTLTVTARPISVVAADKSKIYGDSNPTLTYAITDADGDSTLPNSDTLTGSLTTTIGTSSPVGSGAITQGNLNNANNPNYAITFTPATLTVNAKALSVSGFTPANKTYDGDAVAVVTSKGALSGKVGLDDVDFSYSTATFSDAAVGTNKTVTLSGISLTGGDAGNYTLATTTTAVADINAKTLTLTGFTASNKIYDRTTAATIATAGTLSGVVSGDTVTVSNTGASFADKNVGVGKTVTLAGVSLGGADASNYSIATTATTTAEITAKPISLTGLVVSDKTYNGNSAATISNAGSLDGVITGDALTVSNSGAAFSDKNVGTDKPVTVTGVTLAGTDKDNYSIAATANTTADINAKTVSISVANRAYDGTDDLSGEVTIATGVGSETLTFSGATAASIHAAGPDGDSSTNDNYLSAIILTDATDGSGGLASNYQLPTLNAVNAGAVITPATLTVSLANNGVTKTYDGTINAPAGFTPDFSVSGLISGDSATLLYSDHRYDSADVTTASQITVSGVSLSGIISSGSSVASDYTLGGVSTATVSAAITKAPLTVTANDDAKFVTQSDTNGFAGATYAGFVNAEDSADLGGSLSITRSNSGVDTADSYDGVLVPSGWTSDNYTISFVNGDYTIVPADELLVRMTNVSNAYATDTNYAIGSVEYYDGSNVISLSDGSVGGSSAAINGSNLVSINDGSGGTATFTVAPQDAVLTGAGNLAVGSYALGIDGLVTENSMNFSDTVTLIGAHQVNQKALTVTAAGVSKTYDGTTSMDGVSIGLTGVEASDTVSVSGIGAFNSASASASAAYTLSNLAISGADSGNYYLSGGRTQSGTGVINKYDLTLSFAGVDKVYDGAVTASVSITDDRISGDVITLTPTAAFSDKNVGAGKAVSISGVAITGTDKDNYQWSAGTGSSFAAITQLSSVTWTGGGDGSNWFDPDNWGGAIPDLGNVGSVVIPTGVTVLFDTDNALGLAETNDVTVTTIGSAGSLNVAKGTLGVGSGGVTLSTLTQSGGALSSAGDIDVGTVAQTGGSTTIAGDLTVTAGYSQGVSGIIEVSGDATITDTSGGAVLGNLDTSGDLSIASEDGAITQATGTTVVADGSTSLAASNGGSTVYDVTLDSANNDFGSTVTVTGNDVTITDANALALGSVTASGDFTVAGGADLSISGTTTVGGNADLTATGAITQSSGSIDITGTTALQAGTTINLEQSANDFGGNVSIAGATDVALVDADGLSFGTVTASGDLEATATIGALSLGGNVSVGSMSLEATEGAINQTSGAITTSTGASTFTAGTDVTISSTTNDFNGTVNATGRNIDIEDANTLTLGTVTASGTLDVLSGGNLTVGGTVSATEVTAASTNGSLTVNNVTASTGAIDLDADSDIALNGTITAASALTVDSASGGLTQASSSSVTSTTTTTMNAAADIALDGSVSGSGVDVETTGGTLAVNDVTSTSGAVDLDATGNVAVTGDVTSAGVLGVASSAGTVTQSGSSTISGTGATTIAASGNASLSGTVSGSTVTAESTLGSLAVTNITATSGAVDLDADDNVALSGNVTAANGLTVDSTRGGVNQSSGRIRVTQGASTIAASTDVVLDSETNEFGDVVNASGDDVTIGAAGDLEIGVLTASGDSTLAANGSLDLTGGIVANTITASSATADINVGNVTANVAMSLEAEQTVTMTGTIGVQTTLDVTAGRGVIQQPSGTLTVTNGPATMSALYGNVDLLNASALPGLVIEDDRVRLARSGGIDNSLRGVIPTSTELRLPTRVATRPATIRAPSVQSDVALSIDSSSTKPPEASAPAAVVTRILTTDAVSIGPTGRVFKLMDRTEAAVLNLVELPGSESVSTNVSTNESTAQTDGALTTVLPSLVDPGQVLVIDGGIATPDLFDPANDQQVCCGPETEKATDPLAQAIEPLAVAN